MNFLGTVGRVLGLDGFFLRYEFAKQRGAIHFHSLW